MISFEEIIRRLNNYWQSYGCTLLQPYTTEVGAATLHPATVMNCVHEHPCKLAYVQPVIRPADGRYGLNPNRVYQHHQYQVLLKPNPLDLQELLLQSLKCINILPEEHDIRFVEDDWENPSIGAWGLGWEIWCDGMEIVQYTYMQQVGGIECKLIPGELAYGLERIAMYIQAVDNVFNIKMDEKGTTYGDLFKRGEYEFSKLALEVYDTDILATQFKQYETICQYLIEKSLPLAAYDVCLKASHTLNLLDARGALGVNERAAYLLTVRNLVKLCCENYLSHNLS